MSDYLETVSEILGEYMLKGWTLTDKTCSHCMTTPLMREPVAQARQEGRSDAQRVEFCGRCQGAPGAPVRPPQQTSSFWNEPVSPPTSSTAISPPAPPRSTDLPPLAPLPPRSPISQSDLASSLIGQYLLKGYSLLSSNCPTSTCRGIPLMGHPRRRGDTSPQKRECVICGGVYGVNGEVLSRPRGHVAVQEETGQAEGSNEARRRALYEQGSRINAGEVMPVDEGVVRGTTDEDIDMELEAMVNTPPIRTTTQPTTQTPVTQAIALAERTLSTLLLELSTGLQHKLTTGSSAVGADVKAYVESMAAVLAVLEKAGDLKVKAGGA